MYCKASEECTVNIPEIGYNMSRFNLSMTPSKEFLAKLYRNSPTPSNDIVPKMMDKVHQGFSDDKREDADDKEYCRTINIADYVNKTPPKKEKPYTTMSIYAPLHNEGRANLHEIQRDAKDKNPGNLVNKIEELYGSEEAANAEKTVDALDTIQNAFERFANQGKKQRFTDYLKKKGRNIQDPKRFGSTNALYEDAYAYSAPKLEKGKKGSLDVLGVPQDYKEKLIDFKEQYDFDSEEQAEDYLLMHELLHTDLHKDSPGYTSIDDYFDKEKGVEKHILRYARDFLKDTEDIAYFGKILDVAVQRYVSYELSQYIYQQQQQGYDVTEYDLYERAREIMEDEGLIQGTLEEIIEAEPYDEAA